MAAVVTPGSSRALTRNRSASSPALPPQARASASMVPPTVFLHMRLSHARARLMRGSVVEVIATHHLRIH
jgi:hypothetical protein